MAEKEPASIFLTDGVGLVTTVGRGQRMTIGKVRRSWDHVATKERIGSDKIR
jgi:hypothetical protein